MKKRKICLFTGTRAEFGLLLPLISQINRDKNLILQLIVSGTHLSKEFGLTINEIKKEGIKINNQTKIPLETDSEIGLAKTIAAGIIEITRTLINLKPDILVLLGDRFETFSAAISGMAIKLPIAHIHGGESTFGSSDETMRHSITKMSHLHFVSTDTYRKRVIQLGENPSRVFNVGAIGLDNINNIRLLNKNELEKVLKIKFNKSNILVTFHPVTLENNTYVQQIKNLLNAVDRLKDATLIFTKANVDTGGRAINSIIDGYVRSNRHKAVVFTSLGQQKYLSLMKCVDAVVGNSSSGIIEAPSFKIGTINIGNRQAGRIQAKSTINCQPTVDEISKAFSILYSNKFRAGLKNITNPYKKANTSMKIKNIIKHCDLTNILQKRFHDIK